MSKSEGAIVSDSNGAYAVVLAGNDEIDSVDPNTFQYVARDSDPGRYRLTAGTPESRQPVRILRSHTLHSFWRPKLGIRYDGLCVDYRESKRNLCPSSPVNLSC